MVRKAVYREHYPYPEEPDAAEFTRIHVGTLKHYLRCRKKGWACWSGCWLC